MKYAGMWRRVALTATALLAVSAMAMELVSEKTAKEGPKPDQVFNGKDLKDWKPKGKDYAAWMVGFAELDATNATKLAVTKLEEGSKKPGQLVNSKGHGVDLYSKYLHGDGVIKLEVMVPKGSNSGIYVMGEYEIQVLDSYGRDKNPGSGDMGAIYGAQPPKKPKYKKPGEWQTYEIDFRAPKFDREGKKIANAVFVKIVLNGVTIHENVEMKGLTPGGVDGKEKAKGPIMFQGNHGAVAFRNITFMPAERMARK